MTNKEIAALAAAVRKVADAGEANQLTVRAIVQALDAMIWENGDGHKARSFASAATGVVDLSGTNYLAKIGAAQ